MKLGRLTTRCTLAMLVTVCAASSRAAAERVPVAIEQVSAALHASGLPVDDAVVRMPMRMSSASAAPALSIAAVEPWGERRARVRVACVDHAECLPFYVSLEWADAAAAQSALAAVRTPLRAPAGSLVSVGSKLAAAAIRANTQVTRVGNPLPAPGVTSMPDPGGVHAGARATLRLTGPRIHIEVPVICLEAGAPGQSIRVAAADHKQHYVAEVVDPTLLKGRL